MTRATAQDFAAIYNAEVMQASCSIPFNFDYALVNRLYFYFDQCHTIPLEETHIIAVQRQRYYEALGYFLEVFANCQHQHATKACTDLNKTIELAITQYYFNNHLVMITLEKAQCQYELVRLECRPEQCELDQIKQKCMQITRCDTELDVIAEIHSLSLSISTLNLQQLQTLQERYNQELDDLITEDFFSNNNDDGSILSQNIQHISLKKEHVGKITENLNALLHPITHPEITAFQAAMFQAFQGAFPTVETQTPDNFIQFIQDNAAAYLPTQYMSFREVPRFPSSNKNRCGLGHVDIHPRSGGQLLTIGAPLTLPYAEQNLHTLNTFFETLASISVTHIIALGRHATRLDYTEGCRANNIHIIKVDVEDNMSIYLSNQQLKQIYAAYDIYANGGSIAVHCDSSVGRAGQIRLLFRLLDQYNSDSKFQNICSCLMYFLLSSTATIHKEILRANIQYVLQKMKNALFNLRKIRYCVQTEPQFTESLLQLFLLIRERALSPVYQQAHRAQFFPPNKRRGIGRWGVGKLWFEERDQVEHKSFFMKRMTEENVIERELWMQTPHDPRAIKIFGKLRKGFSSELAVMPYMPYNDAENTGILPMVAIEAISVISGSSKGANSAISGSSKTTSTEQFPLLPASMDSDHCQSSVGMSPI